MTTALEWYRLACQGDPTWTPDKPDPLIGIIAEAQADARREALELAANRIQELKYAEGGAAIRLDSEGFNELAVHARAHAQGLYAAEEAIRALLSTTPEPR